MIRKTFHYRDPAKTPSLRAVFEAIYRRPDDNRPGLSAMEIEDAVRAKGGRCVRASSDVSELRAWAADDNQGEGGRPRYFVPKATPAGRTENGNPVSLFVIYRYSDPRAAEARNAERVRSEKPVRRMAA